MGNIESYFQSAIKQFNYAYESAADAVDFYYNIANRIVRVKFTNRQMANALTPALEHLISDNKKVAQLNICCLDSVVTKIDFPMPPWSVKNYSPRGDIEGFDNERFKIGFHSWANVLSMFDSKENVAIYWTHDYNHLPSYEKSAPFLFILNMCMSNQQRQLIHAAAVGYPNAGVLLVGRSHSGKSTTALSCLSSKLYYAGDDYCLLSEEDTPYIFSLYSSAKLLAQDLGKFPELNPALDTINVPQDDRALYFLTRTNPGKIINGFPLKLILIVKIGENNQTLVKPVRAVEILKTLAPSTMVQLPTAAGQTLRTIANIIRKVPCFSLEIGKDITQISAKIEEVLLKHNSAGKYGTH